MISLFFVSVAVVIWVKISCSLTLGDGGFRLRIALGVVLFRSLVCANCIPGGPRSGSEVALLVGSKETHQARIERLKCGSPSY